MPMPGDLMTFLDEIEVSESDLHAADEHIGGGGTIATDNGWCGLGCK